MIQGGWPFIKDCIPLEKLKEKNDETKHTDTLQKQS